MRILFKVCAEFHDHSGAVLFTVKPHQLLTIIDAPDSIRQDPLFDMLLADHAMEVSNTREVQKRLENDPDKTPEKPAKQTKSAKQPKSDSQPDPSPVDEAPQKSPAQIAEPQKA